MSSLTTLSRSLAASRTCSTSRQLFRRSFLKHKLGLVSVLASHPALGAGFRGSLDSHRREMSSSPQSLSALKLAGNASQDTKQVCFDEFCGIVGARNGVGFGQSVANRLRIAQIDVTPRPEEPIRKEARVVCEITLESDMLNAIDTLHGGCSTFLVDVCSSLPILVLGYELHKNRGHGVSQTISTFYHAPAFLGAELRIVSTSLTYGSRIMSSRCEIWDKKNQRLVASGVHTMMQPSPCKAEV